ncbi:MAG: leucyl aminopeptidase [Holosporales bacterium]|jgi:leucyl aminopeptidase|nr:leucyl aminopeptidase [Holosporales bacterium]
MSVSFDGIKNHKADNLFICLKSSKFSSDFAASLDKKLNGLLTKALSKNKWFKGKLGEYVSIICPNGDYSTVVLVGTDKTSSVKDAQKLGGTVSSIMSKLKFEKASLFSDQELKEDLLANLALGFELKSWAFDKYKTKKPDVWSCKNSMLEVISASYKEVKAVYDAKLAPLYASIIDTRTLINEPANVICPETFAKHAKELASLGVKIEVLSKADMAKLGMNALLGVSQGSVNEPKMVIARWEGAKKNASWTAFVGKGVTFDSGGISIKPSHNMDQMKSDMSGAAAVLGLMRALAIRKASANVVGVMALAENMPSGQAQRPGDIVKTMSGQTVEVLDTDAEGRLVLADALWYAFDRFKPKAIVDLATLTGAIQVALGHEFAGLFCNNESLAKELMEAGDHVGEKLWRMPLSEEFDRQIDSDVADVKNIAAKGRAGSSTAAHFLQRFVGKTAWAHMDIAGVAFLEQETELSCKGATGYGVQLLNEFVARYCEK